MVAEKAGTGCRVWSTARPADDSETTESEMLGEFGDVGRGALIRALRIEGAVAVARPVDGDQPNVTARGYPSDRVEVVAGTG